MVPGIRPVGAAANDQKRAMTPRQAVDLGATHLVVGRPIYKADGTKVTFEALHTFSDEQVEWFKAGSALNIVRQKVGAK